MSFEARNFEIFRSKRAELSGKFNPFKNNAVVNENNYK